MTRAVIEGRLDLDQVTHDALVAHARSDAPYEVCGFLAGERGRVMRHFAIPNSERSMTSYRMDSKAHFAAEKEIDEHGWEMLAIYHSHTHTEAFPSPTDVQNAAYYPGPACLIVSLQDPAAPVVRAFDIVDARITERELLVDGAPAPTYVAP